MPINVEVDIQERFFMFIDDSVVYSNISYFKYCKMINRKKTTYYASMAK